MVLYFSATGNNKYIAERIAESLGDCAVSIEKYTQKAIKLMANEKLGIVVPTYFLELPPNVVSFLNDVTFVLSQDLYVFGVVTYGSTSGASGAHLKRVLQEKGIQMDALFSIITPDTWTITYDLSNADKVRSTLSRTENQLERSINKISRKEKGSLTVQ